MTSPSLNSTHSWTTSGVTCHHRLWEAHTVERHQAWHAIITFGKHTQLNYVGRGMPSSPLGSTNGRTTSGVACHHHLWVAYTVERRQAWLAIIALGWKTRSNDVRRGMPSLPLDSTHSRMTSGMKCNHRVWITHTVERHREWHDITVFGQHTRSNDVGHDMPSPLLESTDGRMKSGVACHHSP